MKNDYDIAQIELMLRRQEQKIIQLEKDMEYINEKLNNKNKQDEIKLDSGEVIFAIGDIMYSGKISGFVVDSKDELTLKTKGYKEINFI